MTESGFVRVVSNPKFASSRPDLGEAQQVLASFTAIPGHHFWEDHMRITDVFALLGERLHGHQQVTDAYLLALAISRKGQLVTLDRAIATLAGPDYARHLLVL